VLWTREKVSLYEKSRTRRALRKADLVLGESRTLVEAAIEKGARRDKTRVMKLGVDLTVFNQKRDKILLRRKLNLSQNANIILCPRSIDKLYNLKSVLRSVPRVISERKNTLFIFIGHHVNDSYLNELRGEAKGLNIEGAVRFLGKVDHAQVAEYHQASDVFVSVSPKDSGPIALQEAMACGSAPVISDLPSVRELVKNEWNGFLVDPYDVDQISEAIIKALRDARIREVFAQRNWAIVEEKCDFEYEMGKLENFYYKLLEVKVK
jgi:glycosyltransferase involved in cell wall biosynthesis